MTLWNNSFSHNNELSLDWRRFIAARLEGGQQKKSPACLILTHSINLEGKALRKKHIWSPWSRWNPLEKMNFKESLRRHFSFLIYLVKWLWKGKKVPHNFGHFWKLFEMVFWCILYICNVSISYEISLQPKVDVKNKTRKGSAHKVLICIFSLM